jgi:hypothetical protein
MNGLPPWVLVPTMEVHRPLNVLKEYLPPPPLWMVLAPTLASTLLVGVSEPLFWTSRDVATVCIVEGSG